MENINIRQYLYHGICGSNSSFGSLYIFESILKTGYIFNSVESKKYGILPKCNIYEEMGYSPRISLGFYPLDQETYSLSKTRHPDFYGKRIIDKIISDHNVNDLDSFIMNSNNLNNNSIDYAWRTYYNGIILLLSKDILKDLKISDYGMLVDEICIDEPINLKKYLKYIAVNDELLNDVFGLLQKYNYKIPIIEFPSGVLKNKKNKILTLEK